MARETMHLDLAELDSFNDAVVLDTTTLIKQDKHPALGIRLVSVRAPFLTASSTLVYTGRKFSSVPTRTFGCDGRRRGRSWQQQKASRNRTNG